jgi:beta-lactamase regulating signal transducer with metallopeptidase domain
VSGLAFADFVVRGLMVWGLVSLIAIFPWLVAGLVRDFRDTQELRRIEERERRARVRCHVQRVGGTA